MNATTHSQVPADQVAPSKSTLSVIAAANLRHLADRIESGDVTVLKVTIDQGPDDDPGQFREVVGIHYRRPLPPESATDALCPNYSTASGARCIFHDGHDGDHAFAAAVPDRATPSADAEPSRKP